MAIRMRRGNEADFDPSKMLPGEWAVSTDTKYVRMCFSPGIVLRMATYEAFESDMAEIRKILSQCQNIQTAVELIQKNVTNSELVIENYVKEAKQYRDEAEQFRNEAFSTTPEGYEDLVKNVSDNTVKIDTIIEKAELNIKNNAKGSNIHLTDSADSNVVALELYGKTEQNETPSPNNPQEIKSVKGKNLLDCRGLTTNTNKEVVFTPVYDDKGNLLYVNANGTATENAIFELRTEPIDKTDTYILSGCTSGGSTTSYRMTYTEWDASWNWLTASIDTGNGVLLTHKDNVGNASFKIEIYGGTVCNNLKFYPMIRLASIKDDTYVPYGLLRIKTQSKNLFDCSKLVETTKNNVTFIPIYENGVLQYINVNGTASAGTSYGLGDFRLEGEFIASNLGGSYLKKSDGTWIKTISDDERINIPVGSGYFLQAVIFIQANKVCDNLKYYPMISKEGGEYIPYQSSEITLSEPIELNGFNDVYDVVTSEGVTRKIKRRRLLRTDGWSVHSNGWIYTMSITDFKYGDTLIGSIYSPDDAFCTHLVYENNPNKITQEYSQGITMWYDTAYSGYRVAVYLPNMTSEEWLTLLDENKVYLVYELATPTTEELQSDLTALKTFYPETHVSNDADCDMSITYTADAKNYIDNKIALLTTALYNNI